MRAPLFALLLLLLPAVPRAAVVSFSPSDSTVVVGQSFTVDLLATFGNLAPNGVIGWGLDLGYDPAILSFDSFVLAPLWSPFPSDDGLAGMLVFPALPLSNTTVTLGTLHFTALQLGSSVLDVSANNPGFEGFFLNLPGLTDPFTSIQGNVAVTPEPGNFLASLLLLGGLGALRGRREAKSKRPPSSPSAATPA